MTDIASCPPQSPRFRCDRHTLERRAGVWLRDFNASSARLGFSIPGHLENSQTRITELSHKSITSRLKTSI
jgi:hypothetical protein